MSIAVTALFVPDRHGGYLKVGEKRFYAQEQIDTLQAKLAVAHADVRALAEAARFEHEKHQTTFGVSGRLRKDTCGICQVLASPSVRAIVEGV